MLFVFIGAVAAGLVMGLFFKAPALVTASAGSVAVTLGVGALAGWPLSSILLIGLGILVALQLGYLIGAWLTTSRDRGKSGNGWA